MTYKEFLDDHRVKPRIKPKQEKFFFFIPRRDRDTWFRKMAEELMKQTYETNKR